jgi:hypothetical protein
VRPISTLNVSPRPGIGIHAETILEEVSPFDQTSIKEKSGIKANLQKPKNMKSKSTSRLVNSEKTEKKKTLKQEKTST